MQERFHLAHLYTAVRITHFHFAAVEKGWSYGDHRHTNIEFKYCAAGSIRMWIDGRSYDLQPGDAVVVKPGLYHRTEPVAGDCEFFVFHFEVESGQVHAAYQLLDSPLIRSGFSADEPGLIRSWIDRFIMDFGDPLQIQPKEEHADSMYDALFLLRIQSRLLELISVLGEAIMRESDRTATAQMQPAQMNLAREAAYRLETGHPDDLRIGELARRLGVHRSYLCDCFKHVYGMSPRMYLNMLRIRQAKALLQDTPYTVEEISQRLHFSSSAHFCRYFRQMTGTTPGRFRNRKMGT